MLENILELLLDTMPYSVWLIDNDGKFCFVNKFYCDILNTKKDNIIGKTIYDLYGKKLGDEYSKNYEDVKALDKPKLFCGYSSDKFLECYIAPVKDKNKTVAYLGILQDNTDKKRTEDETIKQKNLLKTLIDTIPDSIFYKDKNGLYLDCNVAFAKDHYNLEKHQVINKKDIDIIEDKKLLKTIFETDKIVIDTKQKYETKMKIKNNKNFKYMECIKTPLIDENNNVWGIVGVSRDITKKILSERELRKISYVDKLTQAYNRTYFDKKIKSLENNIQSLPISLIMVDVDGLKIINDTLGHLKGDELIVRASNMLKGLLNKDQLLVRWGGDEFIIILKNTTYKEAKYICEIIKNECLKSEYDPIPLSLSLGCATKENMNKSIEDVLKEAEKVLYKEKLPSQLNFKSRILKSFENALEESSLQTKEHTERVVKYSEALGKNMKLNENQMKDLILSSQLHDIGKIGIQSNILLKEGTLTSEEFEIIKSHTEKGYRVAKSNYAIAHIANNILSHHERWDGNGYPMGLKGEEIPLIARIICIVDAYDAMTSNNYYKDAMSKNEAINELKACSGKQFDPNIVNSFIETIEDTVKSK